MKNHFKKIDARNESELFKEFDKLLESKKAMGQSRNEAKKDGSDKNKIYSYNTYFTYRATALDFSNWVKSNHPEVKHARQCKSYVDEYLTYYQDKGLSNWTLKNKRSALSKIYGKDYSHIDIGKCARSEINRSRNDVGYDRHFSEEKHQDLVSFLKHTGLRRSEAERLHGGSVSQHDDGNWYINNVKGKGGKIRDVRILDNDKAVIDKIAKTPKDKLVWENISKAIDIHSYRAYYASELYQRLERENIPKDDLYICRNDLKGVCYDKQAMLEVSRNLGHNRISVIASNYLYKIK